MSGSYAVVWQQPRKAPLAGRLSFGQRSLSLHGRNREEKARLEVAHRDLCGVRRSQTRIGTMPTIELDCRDGDTINLASLDYVGARTEILENLQRIVSAHA
jgi:hypothetical protein